jgi:exodeoxyribonuclease V alpha subunit
MKEQIQPTSAAEALAPIDRHFAALMSRLSGDSSEVKLAAAWVSQQCRLGNICVDLEQYETNPPPAEIAAELGVAAWPPKALLLTRLKNSPVIGRPGEFKPLILDAQNRLYLQRYWQYESDLAASIRRLAGEALEPGFLKDSRMEKRTPHPGPLPIGSADSADAEREKRSLRHDDVTHREVEGGHEIGNAGSNHLPQLKSSISALFPKADGDEIDWQLVAAFAALRRRLCIISGGPGTGKTRTVVVLLALLLEQHPALRIALAAPTGKAAARLQEALKTARATLPCAPAVRDLLPTEAGTIHRLLGYIPDSAYFRHDAENPLPFDVLLVDEASMVDLALMAKLVAAIPPSGRLILLGDKDQLASVEAGAVLADFCNGSEQRCYSSQFAEEFKEITGRALPPQSVAKHAPQLADCIVELRRNYRFAGDSGIHRISQAVNEGNAGAAIEHLREAGDPAGATVVWKELPAAAKLKETLKPQVLSRFKDYLSAANPLEAIRAFGQFRILCAVRHGPYGVENLNRMVEEILSEAGLICADDRFYPGRPVMIVRNDYNLRLFNGDIGFVRANEAGELRACFAGADQTLREVMPLRLPEHETAFAMTVHKSQGSEFERVLLILPRKDSPVLSRELVYTGLTRASRAVELWTEREIFASAVRRKISRRSGLREALWPARET